MAVQLPCQCEIYDSLTVDINGVPVRLTHTDAPSNCPMAVEGIVPKTLLSVARNLLTITFHVDHTISRLDLPHNSQPEDTRKLGLAFDWIQFQFANQDTLRAF